MAEATFRHGEPLMVDYTAAATLSAGQVVLLGNTTSPTCGVVHRDIANAAFDAIAIGGGVYECVNLDNAANYVPVWWNDSVNKLTTTSTNNAKFGFVVRDGGGGANTNCLALHHPIV